MAKYIERVQHALNLVYVVWVFWREETISMSPLTKFELVQSKLADTTCGN